LNKQTQGWAAGLTLLLQHFHSHRTVLSPQPTTELIFDYYSETWALQARDRLHGRYLKSLKRLRGYWEKQENWEIAHACYERSMEVDIALARCA